MDARARTRNYDLFKGAVAVGLVIIIIIIILLLQERGARPEARMAPAVPSTAELAAAAPTAAVATAGQPMAASTAVAPTAEQPTAAPTAMAPTAEQPTAAPTAMAPTAEQPTAIPEPVGWAAATINPPKLGEGGQVSLSGTGQPGTTVEVWAGNVKLASVPVGPDGTWSWDGTLEPGDHEVVARTVDGSGKAVNESTALPITVEAAKTPATLTLNEPEIGAQGSITLTGTAEPGTAVEVVADGTLVGSAVAQEDGTWSLVYQPGSGKHQLGARSQADPTLVSAMVSVEVPGAVPEAAATPGQGEGYIVQKGDSLSALAQRFYGNGALWRLIYDATNAQAAQDPSFHAIANPGFIKPGWKLWIPVLAPA